MDANEEARCATAYEQYYRNRGPGMAYLSWRDQWLAGTTPVQQQDERMNNIIRNGNDGEHYELERSPTPTNYVSLQEVLDRAFDQAAYGKGAQRHAGDAAFEAQPMQKLIDLYGLGFALGQAGKKMQECRRLDTDAAVRELLGAINYIAGAIINLEKNQ